MSEVKRGHVKDWFDGTLYSRLDSKKDDVIILVMQRVHEDDLVGHVLAKDGDWVHLDLPAIAEEPQSIEIGDGVFHERAAGDVLHPERESPEILEGIRAEMGGLLFSAQYQQRPVPVEGNIVKWDWFRTYTVRPAYGPDGRIVQSWDTASKAGELNDYSVCTTWLVKGRDYYLLDVMRERLEYPLLRKRVVEMKQRLGCKDCPDRGQGIRDPAHPGPEEEQGAAPDRGRPGSGQGHPDEQPVGQDRGRAGLAPRAGALARDLQGRDPGLPERQVRRPGRQRLAVHLVAGGQGPPGPAVGHRDRGVTGFRPGTSTVPAC